MAADYFQLGDTRIANRRRHRIGMIVPASNSNAEPDAQLLSPPGVTIHVTRSGGYDPHAIPDADEMRRFVHQALDEQLQLLVDAEVELIAYACTSATLAEGPDFDKSFCAEIERKSGVPAATTAGAIIEALQDLGARRVAFTSPYVPDLNRKSIEFIEACEIRVVNQLGFDAALDSHQQNDLTPEDAYRMGLAADRDDADALVISCTAYRSLEAVPALEKALDKPVVTSNSALMYVALKRLGIDRHAVSAGGRLFALRN